MTTRSYDLSIISAQEAADRLGVRAAEAEEVLERFDPELDEFEETVYSGAANAATIALDILALRKAQVALEENRRLKQELSDLAEAYDDLMKAQQQEAWEKL